MAPEDPLLEAIRNLSHWHREHEKHYAAAPLEDALALQRVSRTLKALAERWSRVTPTGPSAMSPFAGADDLNDERVVEETGVLFMEGEGKPAELTAIERELVALAQRSAEVGAWLAQAMEQSWAVAERLLAYPQLADLLGERHRIIANAWQNAGLAQLGGRLVERAVAILAAVDFRPTALREDLAGPRTASKLLFSAAELLDRAADLAAESAVPVHENDRRWRVFHARVEEISR